MSPTTAGVATAEPAVVGAWPRDRPDRDECAGDASRGIVETAQPAHVLLRTMSGRTR
jgi:hypothetical protein